MDENQTRAPRGPDPFRDLLRHDGPWTATGGVRLRHQQTGEAFGMLAVADPEEAPRWNGLVESLEGLDSERLVVPRAVIDDGAAVLYCGPDELGTSFASLLAENATLEQDETMRMAADLAAALRELHACGAVLGRLRLQDVLRAADGGWALLLSPASGAHAAAGHELARQACADVVLLASAAVTVLTGRRPSAARNRPPLRSTHPLLDPQAADALDLVLERAGQQEGAGQSGESGMLTASELEQLLRPEAQTMAGSSSWTASAEVEEPEEPTQLLLLRPEPAAEPRPSQRSERPARSGTRQVRGGVRSVVAGSARPAPAAADPRRPRRVLVGAAAIVIGASALAGWQILSGPDDGSPNAGGSPEQASGEADAREAASGEDSATEQPEAAAAGPSAQTQAAAGEQPSAGATAVSAQLSPEYASAALIAQRADALRTGDRDLLESVYVPEAADLADDLETMEQAQSEGAFTDLQMVLGDAAPLGSGSRADGDRPSSGRRTASVTGTVKASGTDLDPARRGEATLHQDVSIELVADDGAWRILDVTPI